MMYYKLIDLETGKKDRKLYDVFGIAVRVLTNKGSLFAIEWDTKQKIHRLWITKKGDTAFKYAAPTKFQSRLRAYEYAKREIFHQVFNGVALFGFKTEKGKIWDNRLKKFVPCGPTVLEFFNTWKRVKKTASEYCRKNKKRISRLGPADIKVIARKADVPFRIAMQCNLTG